MYELYAATGCVLILTGLSTAMLAGYFMAYFQKSRHTLCLTTSQALATIVLGAFQVYSAIVMTGTQEVTVTANQSHLLFEITLSNASGGMDDGNYFMLSTEEGLPSSSDAAQEQEMTTVETEAPSTSPTATLSDAEEPIPLQPDSEENVLLKENRNNEEGTTKPLDQFLLNYQKLFGSLLKQNYRQPHQLLHYKNSDCDFESIYLKNALLVYSFVNAITGLFNSALKCKPSDNKLNLFKPLLTTWTVPIISLSLLYFVIQHCMMEPQVQESSTSFAQWIKPLNVTSSNTTQLNNIVNTVYGIVNEANAPDFNVAQNREHIDTFLNKYFSKRQPKLLVTTCIRPLISFKLFAFFLFIITSFSVFFYVSVVRVKMGSTDKYLQTHLYAFVVLWLPSVTETIARVYFMDQFTGVASQGTQVFGNLSHVVANGTNVMFARKLIKQLNCVKPDNETEEVTN